MPTGRPISRNELWNAIDRVPRYRLGHLPTPLEPMRNLSEHLGGPTLWIKRDDCTGLALGGNKTRHNEFLLGEALAQGADCFVWGAGVQSNNCRQTAAACARAGLPIHLILSRAHGPSDDVQGNLLLMHILGATVEIVDAPLGPELNDLIRARADELRERGRRPFFWNENEVTEIAAISYVPCVLEIVEQSLDAGIDVSDIYVAAAGSTGAGLALGQAALGIDTKVHSIAPIDWPWDTAEYTARIANGAAQRMQIPHRLEASDVNLSEDYIKPEYGVPGPDCLEALALVARKEAIFLDPVYSGKAMAGLIDHIRRGDFSPDQNIVFVHTGGMPALFAMNELLHEGIPAAEPM